jgi:hypothetical protein
MSDRRDFTSVQGARKGFGSDYANLVLEGNGKRSNNIKREDHLSGPFLSLGGEDIGTGTELRSQQPSVSANFKLHTVNLD